MRVGILTLGLGSNYGNILQAYALQTVLENVSGKDNVKIISQPYVKKTPNVITRPLVYFYRKILLKLGLADKWIRVSTHYEEFQNKERKHLASFVCKYLNIYKIKGYNDVKEKDFDIIVVGSDQVWRPQYWLWQSDTIADAFLSFTKGWNIKRIAYAPSFGTDTWEFNETQTRECLELIKTFDNVSCREEEGIMLCKKYLGCQNVSCVLDPTMLLQQEDYLRFVNKIICSNNKLLVYILDIDNDKQALVDKIADDKKLTPYYVFDKKHNPLSIEQWLQKFYEADYVVTDSFHACVFSIIFGKPFIVYGNSSRGISRFATLLRTFHLEDRFLTSYNDYEKLNIQSKIEDAQEELQRQREKSLKWITECFK